MTKMHVHVRIISRANVQSFIMDFFARKAREDLSPLLEEGERIMLVSRQSLMNDIAPAFIIATDCRILIINGSFWASTLAQTYSRIRITIPYLTIG